MHDILIFAAAIVAVIPVIRRNEKRFEEYRIRANERLMRLERGAYHYGWDIPRCSFGFFDEIDVYPNSDIDDESPFASERLVRPEFYKPKF